MSNSTPRRRSADKKTAANSNDQVAALAKRLKRLHAEYESLFNTGLPEEHCRPMRRAVCAEISAAERRLMVAVPTTPDGAMVQLVLAQSITERLACPDSMSAAEKLEASEEVARLVRRAINYLLNTGADLNAAPRVYLDQELLQMANAYGGRN